MVALALLLILAALVIIHAFWGMGFVWPAASQAELVALVIGRTPNGKMPPPLACFSVATCLLVVMFLLIARVLGEGSALGLLFPLSFWGATAVFALRGIAGFVPALNKYALGTPFYKYNLLYYSPLCLILAIGFAFVWMFTP